MTVRTLTSTFACLCLVVALGACSTSAGSSGEPNDDATTRTEPGSEDDATTTDGGAGGGGAGGDGEDPDTDVYVEALVTGMSAGDPGEDLVLTVEEARCVAPVWIDTLGTDALSGLDPQELADPDDLDLAGIVDIDEDQAGTMIGAYADCDVDISEKFASYLTLDLPADQAACVSEALAEEDLTDLLELALVDEDEAEARFTATLEPVSEACGVEE